MKQHHYNYFILLTLLSTWVGWSQNHSVSGFIEDDKGESIAFAHVILKRANDSSVVKGVSSNDNGFFIFDKLAADSYLIQFSFMGYNDIETLVAVDGPVDLETVVMTESSQELDAISIIAKRPTLRKMADRLVFNVENTPLIEGNMFEVIKNTPGILVLDNTIQVKNTSPTIYINDRLVHLSGDELIKLLESSPANTIKSVEVITNPSVKYDADSEAVVNIVMSKNLVTGYNGNIFFNYTQGVFPKYDGGMSHFFKNDKIDFFANYTYSDGKINRDDYTRINYLDNSQVVDQVWKSEVNRNTWSKTHNFNFNLDYAFDDRNTLSVSSVMLWLPHFKYRISNHTNVSDAYQNTQFYYDATNLSNDDKYNLGFDLDYGHQFKNPNEKLSVNAHFTTYDYRRDQNVSSNYFNAENIFLNHTAYRTDNKQKTNIFTAQADYTLPLNTQATLDTGLKMSKIDSNSSIAQFYIDNDGLETPDVLNSNAFDYNEDIFAAYVNYAVHWGELNLTTGLRAEQTTIKGISVTNNEASNSNYLEWFPMVSLNYDVSDNLSVYSNYKRSITRPDYASLNPFRFFLNDNTIVTGNPNLRPVIVNHAELGTTLFGRFTVEAYYKTASDNIFELPIQDNVHNTLTFTPVNIDKTIEFGFDFVTFFDIVENWSAYVATSFYNSRDQGRFDDAFLSRNQWSNYSMFSNEFTFLKDESLMVNLTLIYSSKNQQGFIEVDNLFFSELSATKSVLKNRGTISLTFSDLFKGQDFRTKSHYLNQYNLSTIKQDTRTFKLGFRYKFGNTSLETNQRHKSQEETERLE